MNKEERFEGFEYKAEEIHKYIYTVGVFTISLRNGKIIHHDPKDSEAFKQWLDNNNIIDLRLQ